MRPGEASGLQTAGRERELVAGAILAALMALALALRFWRLGEWTLEGDEIYTFRDSLRPLIGNPRPLLFLLNYYVVRPLTPLDEFGLRLLPALSGALTVPALYFIGRRLVGARAALFGALLVALNPMHVYQSQYARYWSLVILLSAIYPYALYLGVRERSGRWLALGLVTGVLAVLAHPISVLLIGGLGLLVVLHLRRDVITQLWSQRAVRWIAILIVILAVIAALRSIDMLQSWISAHDLKTRVPDHLRDAPREAGLRQLAILGNYTDGLTLPVTLSAVVGIFLLWRRDRPLALLLVCLFIVPVATILLLSFRTPVSVTYLLPTAPAIFIGAGVFLDCLAAVDLGLRPRWLLPATITALIVSPGLPSLFSQYRDGRRYDFRRAAGWLEPRLADGDVVFSAQSRVLTHYLQGKEVQPLAPDTAAIAQAARAVDPGRALWIVTPAPSHTFRSSLQRGGLIGWLYGNCQLRNSFGVGRMDFRQQYLHIYRCPPTEPAPAGAADKAGSSPFRARTSR
ncbi:MAG: glycosyltransferase family 39 protein [Gemmatimonadales bacterium]